MRYITEQELRETFAQGIPDHYTAPADARLTPSARQYLRDLRLYQQTPAKPCGAKPEEMTHLNASELVRKDDPRIVFRGKLDSLEAYILCAQVAALRYGLPVIADQLEETLCLVRNVLACDFKHAPLGDWTLGGLSASTLREVSHNPKRFLAEGHVLPQASQGEMAALLNRLRTIARETEAQAVATYTGYPPLREDIITALNRLSSFFYILQLQTIAAQRGGIYGS